MYNYALPLSMAEGVPVMDGGWRKPHTVCTSHAILDYFLLPWKSCANEIFKLKNMASMVIPKQVSNGNVLCVDGRCEYPKQHVCMCVCLQ